MSVTTETSATFTGTPTTTEERQILRDAGFVHVTGLVARDHTDRPKYVIGERVTKDDMGKWDANNGKAVLITTGGEVWLRAALGRLEHVWPVFRQFCPQGRSAFVPLSNGETVYAHDLLARVADPNYELAIKTTS